MNKSTNVIRDELSDVRRKAERFGGKNEGDG